MPIMNEYDLKIPFNAVSGTPGGDEETGAGTGGCMGGPGGCIGGPEDWVMGVLSRRVVGQDGATLAARPEADMVNGCAIVIEYLASGPPGTAAVTSA
jgi:hypothetical protein